MAAKTRLENHLLDMDDPKIFATQSQRLSALLDAVVEESGSATDPDACVDYLELTEILADLLNQSQLLSVLSPDQLGDRRQEVKTFVGKIETIQDAIADWDNRTHGKSREVREGEDMASTSLGKRLRSSTVGGPEEGSKRLRESELKQEVDANATSGAAQGYTAPAIERTSVPWWTEPLYD